MITALYVRRNSIYKKLGIDCWDIDRDARNWPGGNPCIAHPPCAQWGRLYTFATPCEEQKQLGIIAVAQVRKWGGVLEHPAHSKLWMQCGIPPPGRGHDAYMGWSLSVDQSWFGHRACKKTWLYIVGVGPKSIPPYSISFDAVQYVVSNARGCRPLPSVTKTEREKTPIDMARWLIYLVKAVPSDWSKRNPLCRDATGQE